MSKAKLCIDVFDRTSFFMHKKGELTKPLPLVAIFSPVFTTWKKIEDLRVVRDGFKEKIKIRLLFQGEEKECYVSTKKVKITANKKWINVVFIYGLEETPMMIASNISIKSKDDVIRIARYYLDRWRIEEYFKFKKQEYNFENFKVRGLKSINNLNTLLTYSIGLIAMLSEKIGKRELVNKILKEKVYMWFYQLARGYITY